MSKRAIPFVKEYDNNEGYEVIPFKYGPTYEYHINGRVLYNYETFTKALQDPKLEELYGEDRLFVEFVYSPIRDIYQDLSKIVGVIRAIDDNNIYVEKNLNWDSIIPKECEGHLLCFMRLTIDSKYLTNDRSTPLEKITIDAFDIFDNRIDEIAKCVHTIKDLIDDIPSKIRNEACEANATIRAAYEAFKY